MPTGEVVDRVDGRRLAGGRGLALTVDDEVVESA